MKLAISIGDLNGIGAEIAIRSHESIKRYCEPLYCVSKKMLSQAADKLSLTVPADMDCTELAGEFTIEAGKVCAESGRYSYESFKQAVYLTEQNECAATVTLPINKESWYKTGIPFVGHTDALRAHFKQDAIMVMGIPRFYVALFTEHLPIKKALERVNESALTKFLITLQTHMPKHRWGVLGLNPHAGDNGVLGSEDFAVAEAIQNGNTHFGENIFFGPLVPDIAFTRGSREYFENFVCLYHDQGLAPLKALYFEECINISLALPIIRTSVGHGTAFDIAYSDTVPNTKSYTNAIKGAVELASCKLR